MNPTRCLLVPPVRRLLVLACSATKADAPGQIPAIHRYNGPLWQTLRACDPNSALARVAYLSALYGFGDAQMPLANYDARLTKARAREMIADGIYAGYPKAAPGGGIGGGWSANGGINLLCDVTIPPIPFSDVALCGGRLYLGVMSSFVCAFQKTGHVATDARIIEINGPLGIMRQQLRAWLMNTPTTP